MKNRDQKAMHAAADRIEPALAACFRKAVMKAQAVVPLVDLAHALARRDVKACLALLDADGVRARMAECGDVVEDAVLRGGRIGADLLNKAL